MWKTIFSVNDGEEAEKQRQRQQQLERQLAADEAHKRRQAQSAADTAPHPVVERDYSQWRSHEEAEADDKVSRELARRLAQAEEEQRRQAAVQEQQRKREAMRMSSDGEQLSLRFALLVLICHDTCLRHTDHSTPSTFEQMSSLRSVCNAKKITVGTVDMKWMLR